MNYRGGKKAFVDFAINDATGAAANADALPTATLYRNGVADATVDLTMANPATGAYLCSFLVPTTYTVGDDIRLLIEATVGGIECIAWKGEGTVEASPIVRRLDPELDDLYYVGEALFREGMTDANTYQNFPQTPTPTLDASFREGHIHPATAPPVQGIWLRYWNGADNDITVGASAVDNSGRVYMGDTAGASTVLIPKKSFGDVYIPDVLLVPGVAYQTISYVAVDDTSKTWPMGSRNLDQRTGDGWRTGDGRATNTGFATGSGYRSYRFGPQAIYARCGTPCKSAAFVGDSIVAGVDAGRRGWPLRGCAIAGIPCYLSGLAGETMVQFLSPAIWQDRVKELVRFGTVYVEYGINDVEDNASLATMKANVGICANRLAAMGIKVIFCTLTPKPGMSSGKQQVRDDYNAWLRSGQAQTNYPAISGIVDIASAVESNSAGGVVALGGRFWASVGGATSNDLVHPNDLGADVIGAYFATVAPGQVAYWMPVEGKAAISANARVLLSLPAVTPGATQGLPLKGDITPLLPPDLADAANRIINMTQQTVSGYQIKEFALSLAPTGSGGGGGGLTEEELAILMRIGAAVGAYGGREERNTDGTITQVLNLPNGLELRKVTQGISATVDQMSATVEEVA